MIHFCFRLMALESEGWIHGIGRETPPLLFFKVKMFPQLGILFIMKLYMWVSIFAKNICIWKSYFWNKHAVMFPCNLVSQNVKNLCPYFQKPSLTSKIPGYAPDMFALYHQTEWTNITRSKTKTFYLGRNKTKQKITLGRNKKSKNVI